MLSIQTVPDLRLFHDGVPVSGLMNTKGGAIAAFLALTGGHATRTRLAGLLWSDLPEADAQNNLRFTLSRLRRQLPDVIVATRNEIRTVEGTPRCIDVEMVETAPPADLIALRVEDFLANLIPSNAEGFREWVEKTRDDLCQRYLARMTEIAEMLAQAGETDRAADAYRRCLALDPWSERYHRALARLHIDRGDATGALAQLTACREVLRRELSVDPDPRTLALETEIRSRKQRRTRTKALDPSSQHIDATDRADFGMVAERQRLQDLVLSPASRIVTVLGPGGVGKTHLAGILVRTLAPKFAAGMAEVRLDDIEPRGPGRGATILMTRIAAGMGIDLVPGRELASLAEAAAPRHQVVLVDNFETIGDAWPTLAALSERAPGLKFVVTSRHQLGLPTEWVVRLDGLDWPRDAEWRPEHANSPAVALFCGTAERLGLPIDLQRDGPSALRICAALEGWPLGLILAASWLQAFRPAEVAQHLEHGPELLSAPAPLQIAMRHHSATAVLDRSWQLLDQTERAAFSALCVFAGPFEAGDAAVVAGVAPAVLASLTGKSIIRRDRDGAWSIHPLLRSFGYQHLKDDRERCAKVEAAHFARSATALAVASRAFEASGDPVAFEAARERIGDHLAAFRRGSASPDRAGLEDHLAGLWLLHRFSGWIEDGLLVLEEALRLPDVDDETRAQWQLWRSDALFQLGRIDGSNEAARAVLEAIGERPPAIPTGLAIAIDLGRMLLDRPRRHPGGGRAILASRAWSRISQVCFFEGDRDAFVAAMLRAVTYREGSPAGAVMAGNALVLNYTPFRASAGRMVRRAERALADADPLDRAWTHELLGLHLLGVGELDAGRRHALDGAAIFRRLNQWRNWAECQALAAYGHSFGGRIPEMAIEMRALRDDGARVRDAASEVWGMLGGLYGDLSREGPPPSFDIGRARALAVEVPDPNTRLLLHGVLAWFAAREGRLTDARDERAQFDAAHRGTTMLSVYALHGFVGDLRALKLIAEGTGKDMREEAKHAMNRYRAFAAVFPAARPFLARAQDIVRQMRP